MPIPGDRAAAARTAASEAETTVLPRARARAWGAGGSAGGRALSGGAADASASYGGRAGAAPGTGISTGTPWSRAGIAAPSSAGLGASGPGAPGTRASGPAAPTPALAPRNRFGLWLILGLAASIVVVAWALAATAVPPPTLAAGPETEPPPPATTTAPPPPPSPTTTEVPLVVVPELASGTLAAARDALAAAGLTLGTVSAENSALAAETVLAADPVSGSSLAAGGTVNLVVASGSNSVPRIAGSTQADALAGLRSAGFEALVTTRADDAPPGTVLGSAPAEGAVARIGTTISVVIATPRPPVSTPTITPPPTSTSTPTPNPTDTAEPRPPSEG
jgi:serine/threonine-protein kinase